MNGKQKNISVSPHVHLLLSLIAAKNGLTLKALIDPKLRELIGQHADWLLEAGQELKDVHGVEVAA